MSSISSKSITCAINYNNNPDGIFTSGQNLTGTVIVTCTKSKRIRAVLLTISGKATTRWETGFGNDLTTYTGDETLLESKHVLIGEINGPEFELHPGVYDYSFKCFLPEQLPTSLETTVGKIRYNVTVCVDIPSKIINDKFVAVFTILKPLDLNLEPADIRLPCELSEIKTFCCCCCSFTGFNTNVQIGKTGYVPGQIIDVFIKINNTAGVMLKDVDVILKKIIKFRSSGISTTEEIKTVTKKCITISPHQSSLYSGPGLTLNEHLLIPTISPTLLNSCKIIDVLYSVDVVSLVSGCHQDPKVSIPITIGTIALRDFSGENSEGVCGTCQNIEMPPPSYSDSVLKSYDAGLVVENIFKF